MNSSPLFRFEQIIASYGRMAAASIRSSSIVKLPSYSRWAPVTVARWILDLSICRNIMTSPSSDVRLPLLNNSRDSKSVRLPVRGVGKRLLNRQARADFVVPEYVHLPEHRRRGLDSFGVELFQRF